MPQIAHAPTEHDHTGANNNAKAARTWDCTVWAKQNSAYSDARVRTTSQSTMVAPERGRPANPLKNLSAYSALLRHYNYDLTATVPPMRPGLPWHVGPLPNREILGDKMRIFNSLQAAARQAARNTPEDMKEIRKMEEKVQLD